MRSALPPSSLALGLAACLLPLAPALAGDPLAGLAEVPAGRHTLFNPTPREQWRELSPDRPDVTESPITVDAGAWAIEASYFEWRRNRGDEGFTFMETNLKVGLTDNIDFQTVFDAYTSERPVAGPRAEGFSDVTLRLKTNLWGNDGGPTALATMPFVKIPTNTELSNGKLEGGVTFPFAMDLAEGVGMGLQTELGAVHDGIGGYDLEFLHTAVIGLDLTERLGCYAEYFGVTGPGPYQAYCAGGFTLLLSPDHMLDWGARVGLNDAADDLAVFGGFTVRF
jgi:hypothetical protein